MKEKKQPQALRVKTAGVLTAGLVQLQGRAGPDPSISGPSFGTVLGRVDFWGTLKVASQVQISGLAANLARF